MVCVYSGILFSLKKEKILSLATMQMNLEDIKLSEISQMQTNITLSHLHVKSKGKKR